MAVSTLSALGFAGSDIAARFGPVAFNVAGFAVAPTSLGTRQGAHVTASTSSHHQAQRGRRLGVLGESF